MIAALLTTLMFAQLPEGVYEARVIAEPPEAPFHKQITLTIEVISDPALKVVIPPLDPAGLGGLNIYGAPEHIDALTDDDRRRVAVVYTLDAVHPKDYPISSVLAKVGDSSFRIPVPPVRFRGLTPEEDAQMLQTAPNANPSTVPPRNILPWLLVAGGVTLAAAAVIFWFLRSRKHIETRPPPRAPWELAYDRLRMLDAAGLPAAGKFGRYYIELSDIIRHYVEDRYEIHAPEQTTPEFLTAASQFGTLSTDQQDMLAAFLKLCDRVKFARYASSVEEAEQSMADILQFIDDSVVKEIVKDEEAAA